MRLYLIGFMGSGKSVLGQQAAGLLDVPFLDTDKVAESQAGMSVSEVFKSYGELYFRQLEADVLRQSAYYTQSIIATGGGLPCFETNMEWMLQHGITLYLQWPETLLHQNLASQTADRPLLEGLSKVETQKKISSLLEARIPVYEQAAITLEMSGQQDVDLANLVKVCRYLW